MLFYWHHHISAALFPIDMELENRNVNFSFLERKNFKVGNSKAKINMIVISHMIVNVCFKRRALGTNFLYITVFETSLM